MDWIGVVSAFLLGAVVGSFLNVVIHRLPLGLSLVHPPSACPQCGAAIKPWQNIPIVSYLLLGGKCAGCGVHISMRYPLVETLMGLLSALLWLRYGLDPLFGVHFVFIAALVAATFIDLDHRIIPDSISLGGIVVGFAVSFFTPLGWAESLIGIAAGAGTLFIVSFGFELITGKEGMGMGDVKLLGAIGAFLGWPAVVFTIFVSSVVGSVVGIITLKVLSADRNFQIPFGPFLSFGAALYVYYGPELIEWYFQLMG